MEHTAHTPGPWAVRFERKFDWAPTPGPITGAHGETVAMVGQLNAAHPGDSNPERDANARLIAAAPTYHDFIESVARLSMDGENGFDMTNDDAVSTLHGLILAAREMIRD